MIIVGLTGGIGSGKTTVAKQFKKLGVPIYIADNEAKMLMNRSKIIKRKLIKLFGEDAYINNELNKPFLAKAIFSDKKLLQQINAIVHPKVARHFEKWVLKQDAPYVISEVAILFENGSYKKYDFIITVTSPLQLRIDRLLKRDKTTKKKIKSIVDSQWDDAEKVKRSHFVISNQTLENNAKQVLKIHKKILKSLQ